MKKTVLFLLLTLTILIASGCGFIAEKITGKVAVDLLDKASGKDADVNIDEGKIIIKDEAGSEIVIGGTKWPTGEAAQTIPVFEAGEIEYVTDSVASAMISLKNVKLSEYTEYIEKLKSEGFTENSYSAEMNGSNTYLAYKTDTNYVSVTFDGESIMIISVVT